MGWGLAVLTVSALVPQGLTQEPAEDETLESLSAAGGEESSSDQPIAIEMAQGVELLNDQISQQQELLKTAQTDRERQLIQNHIRMLQKERRSLESLLHKLVGPNVDVLEQTREQKQEQEDERTQKQLERSERFPSQ
jgi:hypothetical protein